MSRLALVTVSDPDVQFDFDRIALALAPLLDRIHYGTGTPEGAVTASVGHIYLRANGGAGTSFYVKESGTGNTGWIGK